MTDAAAADHVRCATTVPPLTTSLLSYAVASSRDSSGQSCAWHTVQTTSVGGGVVPVAIRDDGEIVFLLAKEHHIATWKGSFRWSAFEGGRKWGEDIETATMREWHEESLECVRLECDAASLRRGEYVLRLVLNTETTRLPRYHVTYVVLVPYEPHCVTTFAIKRRSILNLRASADILSEATQACFGTNAKVTDFVVCNVQNQIVFHREDSVTVAYEYPYPTSVSTWIAAQADLEHALERVRYLCCCEVVRGVNGRVVDVVVHDEFLEKHRVRWWSVSELRAVLREGGKSKEEQFRAYFMPVLKELLKFVDDLPCS